MPTPYTDLAGEFDSATVDVAIPPETADSALLHAYRLAQHRAKADWSTDDMPDVLRTIVVRGARRIAVNPDGNQQNQTAEHITSTPVTGVFSRDELRTSDSFRPRAKIGSLRMTRPGLAEAYDDYFLPVEGSDKPFAYLGQETIP